jgi:acetoin utilization deacetylase AcuC-like enzyme
MAITGFFLHEASPLHDTGWGHPEHQGRLRALASTVGRDLLTLHGHVVQMPSADATMDDILRVHTPAQIEQVRVACEEATTTEKIAAIDGDTRVSSASWSAAIGSAGTSIEAARTVADRTLRNAFVATRPPGHHATPSAAMGFCLFNNVAITARWLQHSGLAEKVLIVDWDVHHGNGTQDVFYADPSVYFLSLHQWPHYPGTGSSAETGSGKGVGTTMNVPLPAGTSRAAYLDHFHTSVDAVLDVCDPDFILVSAGFDSMAGDPLGGLLLEPPDLYQMTRRLVVEAEARCGGRVVALLEGGYDPNRLGLGAVAVIRALAALEGPSA